MPDAPVSLANNPAITSASSVGLSWSQGSENGGTSVLDFNILYKQAGGVW